MSQQRVEVEITGGVGNQLFQYAAALALSHRLQAKLVLDISWFGNQFLSSSPRKFQLSDFIGLQNLEITASALHPVVKRVGNYIRLQTQLRDSRVGPAEFGSLSTTRNVRMRGYWQSEKYFAPMEVVLREMMGERRRAAVEVNPWMTSACLDDSVGIHVRRGDYVSNSRTKSVHGVCPPSFYEEGLRYVQKKRNVQKIFVFSDDIQWCKNNLLLDGVAIFVEKSVSDTDQLKLMSFCSHHVISNSSFSWWAAWLGRTHDQIVVYPTNWFADGSKLESMPKGWHPL